VPLFWVGEKRSKLQRVQRMIQVLRQERPLIIQSLHSFTNLYATAAARLLGAQEIGAIRTDAVREVAAMGMMGKLSLKLPRLIAVNSRAALENADHLGAAVQKLHLLPNVIDTSYFTPFERSKRETVTVAIVGRLIPQKRVDRFLHILAHLQKAVNVPVKGIVVGDGPLCKVLESEAATLGLLPHTIQFLGVVPDVRPIYQQADILLLTSDWEGTPNVILEAMATALPVVASNVGGVSDLVQDGQTGYLFPPDNELFAVEKVKTLIENPRLRKCMGQRARQFIEQHHCWQRLPNYLNQLYAKSLNGHQ
jgi:glycosyltransferase involved in cell wall biosynthesis